MPKNDTPAVPESTTLATAELAQFMDYMEAKLAAGASDISSRVLAADTLDAIFSSASGDAEKAESMLDAPLMLTDVDWLESDFRGQDGTYPAFVLLTVSDTNGETHKVSVGANTVVEQVYKLIVGGHLPHAIIIRKVKKATAAGYYPLYLVDGTEQWEKGF